MKWLLDVVFSRKFLAIRGVWVIIVILYLTGVIKMGMFDVTNYAIPEEYLVYMLIAGLVVGLLTAICLRRHFHDQAAYNAGYENPYDMAYDRRYDLGTAVGFILGTAGGMYATPALVDYLFTGAGEYSYALVTALATAVLVVAITTMLHFGIRKWLVKTKDYFLSLIDTVQDVVSEVQGALNDSDDSESAGTETAAAATLSATVTATKTTATARNKSS